MKRKVQVYIEGQRLELFEDEQIQVSSSIQNIQDISKVFTDFSQSFSVPCSKHNNPIFEHFYENALNGTINPNLRRDGYIEIDLTFFRRGKMQLESVQLKNGQPYAYKVTFYGEIRTLKDRFSEDKLSQLDYSGETHTYSGAEVLARVTDGTTNYRVRYPLISSKRVWQYNEPSTPNDNIDTSLGAIDYTELFPALKNQIILAVIANAYGITFTGLFLTDPRFTNTFLVLKNKLQFEQKTETQEVQVISTAFPEYFGTNYAWLQYKGQVIIGSTTYNVQSGWWNGGIFVSAVSTNDTYYIDVYCNGNLVNTISGSGTDFYVYAPSMSNDPGLYNQYTFAVRADGAMDITFNFLTQFNFVAVDPVFNTTIQQQWQLTAQGTLQTLVGNLDISANMPDMKVADYFAGLLKEFNLTCYPIDENTFQIEPLEDWYSKGTVYDITTYTDLDEININRVPLYKKIEFKHAESMSFMNQTFKNFFNRNYGDLLNNYPYDGSEFVVEVPFEQPLFNKFEGIDLQVGYFLQNSPEFQPYVPKPTIVYYNGIQNANYYFDDGTGAALQTDYAIFGQDLDYNGNIHSLNFGQEVSSFYLTTVGLGLYNEYYYAYLVNMFTLNNRLTDVKTILPLSLLTQLKLNDRLIIRDKRYIINEMKSNLTNGEVNFTLLNDFRPLRRKKPFAPATPITKPKIAILLPNGAVQADIDITGTGVISVDIATMTQDTLVEFEIPAFSTPVEEIRAEDTLDLIVSEDGLDTIVAEGYDLPIYEVPVTYTYANGNTEIEIIDISIR
jgi:hypothetical protein